MPSSKKSRKLHRRKTVRPPTMPYRAYGDLSSWMHGRTALCVAYELALAFENESPLSASLRFSALLDTTSALRRP